MCHELVNQEMIGIDRAQIVERKGLIIARSIIIRSNHFCGPSSGNRSTAAAASPVFPNESARSLTQKRNDVFPKERGTRQDYAPGRTSNPEWSRLLLLFVEIDDYGYPWLANSLLTVW